MLYTTRRATHMLPASLSRWGRFHTLGQFSNLPALRGPLLRHVLGRYDEKIFGVCMCSCLVISLRMIKSSTIL